MENTYPKIKMLLAEHLGIEPGDINDEDSLLNDLHMDPAAISDFAGTLEENGVDVSKIDLTEIETFEDLANALDSSGFIE